MVTRIALLASMISERRPASIKALSIVFIVAQMMTWSRLGAYTTFCMTISDVDRFSTPDYVRQLLSRRSLAKRSKLHFVLTGTIVEEGPDYWLLDCLNRSSETLYLSGNESDTKTSRKSFRSMNLTSHGIQMIKQSLDKSPDLKLVVGLENPWRAVERLISQDHTADVLSQLPKVREENQLMVLGMLGLDNNNLRQLMEAPEPLEILSPTTLRVLLVPTVAERLQLTHDISKFLNLEEDLYPEIGKFETTSLYVSRVELPHLCAPSLRHARERLIVQSNKTAEWIRRFASHPDVTIGGLELDSFLDWLETFSMNPCSDHRIVDPEAAVLYDQMADPAYLDVDKGRSLRFPPVQERVKFYMSSWYAPPCEDYPAGFVEYRYPPADSESTLELRYVQQTAKVMANRSLMLDTRIENDRLFHVRRDALIECTLKSKNRAMRDIYCPEIVKYILPFRDSYFDENGGDVPLIAQMGDAARAKNARRVQLPHLKKVRPHVSAETLEELTRPVCVRSPRPFLSDNRLMPIIWKLKFKRHFPNLEGLASEDVPWEEKLDMAIFRGTLTGPNVGQIENVRDRCKISPRCDAVLNAVNSSLVDAKLTALAGKVPEVLDGVRLLGSLMTRTELLKYKALMMIEGNDVSTGLKWALYSNSVVLIPKPTSSTWAMEGLLVPWIHYVPLKDDFSDMDLKMQWILEHEREARYIARRGALWIHDLLFHRHASEDNEAVDREVLRRYRAHFRPMRL